MVEPCGLSIYIAAVGSIFTLALLSCSRAISAPSNHHIAMSYETADSQKEEFRKYLEHLVSTVSFANNLASPNQKCAGINLIKCIG